MVLRSRGEWKTKRWNRRSRRWKRRIKRKLKKSEQKTNKEINPEEEIDLDETTYFIEDLQTIAAENWKTIEISNEEARKAINLWFTPEKYYEYKNNN